MNSVNRTIDTKRRTFIDFLISLKEVVLSIAHIVAGPRGIEQ